jgi:hypothetical protein
MTSKLGAQRGWGGAFGTYRTVGEAVVLLRADRGLGRKSSKRIQCGEPHRFRRFLVFLFRFFNLRARVRERPQNGLELLASVRCCPIG